MPETIFWGLVEWAMRATALAAVVGLLLWGLRIKDVSLRLAAWTTVLLGVLLLPIAALVPALVPQLFIPVPRPPVKIEFNNPQTGNEQGIAVTQASDTQGVPLGSNIASARNTPVQTLDPSKTNAKSPGITPSSGPLWAKVAIGLWLTIAAAMLIKLLLGLWLSRRLMQTGIEVQKGVRESSAVTVPVTVGLMQPVILLPTDWHDWDEQKLHAVLAHEQSHVRRHDPLCQLAASVYRALCWFHPLAWWLSAKLAECAEAASDDAALQAVPGHIQYAEILLGFLERAPRRVQWAGIPMAKKETAARRIDRILDSRRRLSIALTRGALLALVLLAVPVIYMAASLRPVWAAPTAIPVASSQLAHDANALENLSPRERELADPRNVPVPVPAGNKAAPRQTPLSFLNQSALHQSLENQKDSRKTPAEQEPRSNINIAQNEADSRSTSSVSQSLAAPTQLLPPNGTAWPSNTYPRTIKFQWSAVPGATSYGIEINCFTCCIRGKWCSDVGGLTHIERGLTEPTYTLDSYYGSQPGSWRIWAINDKSEDGPASPWWEFSYSQANDPMRFPTLPSNTAPPAQPVVRVVPPVPLVEPAPKDGVVGPDGSSVPPSTDITVPSSSSTPTYTLGQVSTPPKAIYSPEPSYTDAARKAKISGYVVLHVIVGGDGLVKQVTVAKGLTPDLNESAIKTIKTWRFQPALRDGVPVSISTDISVSFMLY